VFIPDKYLYYLPFETLCKHIPDNIGVNFNRADYLIKRHEIIYHYSTTLYYQAVNNRYKKVSESNSFVGYAPVFCKDSTNGYILSNAATIVDSSYVADSSMRSVSKKGTSYNELAYSEKEIKTIQTMFDKKGMKASGYFFSNATEGVFRETAPLYKYVHIASHGFINENNPYLSGIVFSQNNTVAGLRPETKDSLRFRSTSDLSSSSDGILFSGEMFDLDLNADLIVLSACETGLGKIINGEGIMSMTRGFIYSGTPNILYSLWKVGDKNTQELMVRFYTHILNGYTYTGALRKAKLTLMNNDKTAFPKFWSGFTLLGIN
jgi:CHAT domain-containing protein